MRGYLQDRKLQWFGHLERIEEKTYKVSGRFPRRPPTKTWNVLIRNDLKERKVRKDLTKGRNA